MSRIVQTMLLVAAFLGLWLVSTFVESNRYELVRGGGDAVMNYKLDKKTGRLWMVFGDTQVEVSDAGQEDDAPSNEGRAISMTKESRVLDDQQSSEDAIRDWLSEKKGILRVYGWKARKIDEDIVLVSYTFDEGPRTSTRGWYFEVNLRAEIVRQVSGDPDLAKAYGIE